MPLGHHKNSLQRQQPRLRGSTLAQVWNAPETLKWFQQCCQTNLPAAAIDLWPITGNPAAPLQPAAQAGNIKTCTRYRQLSSWEVQSPYSPPRLYNLHAHGYWTRRLISCGRHPIVLIVQRKAWYCGNLAFICHSSWCHLYRWDCQNNLLKLDNSWSQNATLSCIDLSDSTWVSSSPQFPWHLHCLHNCTATKVDTFQWHMQVMTWQLHTKLGGYIMGESLTGYHVTLRKSEEIYICTYCTRYMQALQ